MVFSIPDLRGGRLCRSCRRLLPWTLWSDFGRSSLPPVPRSAVVVGVIYTKTDWERARLCHIPLSVASHQSESFRAFNFVQATVILLVPFSSPHIHLAQLIGALSPKTYVPSSFPPPSSPCGLKCSTQVFHRIVWVLSVSMSFPHSPPPTSCPAK